MNMLEDSYAQELQIHWRNLVLPEVSIQFFTLEL